MDGELPGYFRFITILALHAFLEEKVINKSTEQLACNFMPQVDVAIVEVGMGGEYDPTNVIK